MMQNFKILIILVFISFKSTSIFSQDLVKVPTLNEHKFINNSLVIDPFIKPSFRQSMGMGQSERVNLPPINIGDSTFSRSTGTLIYAFLNFQLDLHLKDWLSYYFRVGGSARVGVEPGSFYSNGLNMISGITNAWKIRLFKRNKHTLSTMLGLKSYQAKVTNLSIFIDDILNGNPNPNLTQNIYVLQGSMSLQYAYALNSLLGLQAMGQVNYGDLFEAGKSGTQANVSGAIDVNLYPRTNIPFGISIGGGYTTIPDYTAAQYNTTPIFNWKLAYTGAESFLISFDATSYSAPYLVSYIGNKSNAEIRVLSYSLDVIIYFNYLGSAWRKES